MVASLELEEHKLLGLSCKILNRSKTQLIEWANVPAHIFKHDDCFSLDGEFAMNEHFILIIHFVLTTREVICASPPPRVYNYTG